MKKYFVLLIALLSFITLGCSDDEEVTSELSAADLTAFESLAQYNGYTEDDVRKIAGVLQKCGVDVKKLKCADGRIYKGSHINDGSFFVLFDEASDDIIEIKVNSQLADKKVKVHSVEFNSSYDAYKDGDYGDHKAKDFILSNEVKEKIQADILDKLENKYKRNNVQIQSADFNQVQALAKDKEKLGLSVRVKWTEKDATFGAKKDKMEEKCFYYSTEGKFYQSDLDEKKN